MTPQRRKERTAELFHEALIRGPNQYSAFLQDACAGDDEMLRQIRALLGAYAEVRTSCEVGSTNQQRAEFAPDPAALLALSERYDDIEFIGHGGMGVVFRARDREIGKLVALKMIHPALAADDRAIERFRNEIRIALEITHKNVCRTYALERFPGILLIVMEYVEGETLRTILDRSNGVSVSQGLAWGEEICAALAAAHEKQIVHRDLKPENIMIDRQGHVKVMDFGIARSFQSDQVKTATVVGTPGYMSPEQAAGDAVGPTSDVYSVGLVLYELFTGRREAAASPGPTLGLPGNIERAIHKCLERNPKDRFQSAPALAAALTARPRNRLAQASVAGIALLIVVLTVWLATRWHERKSGLSHNPTPTSQTPLSQTPLSQAPLMTPAAPAPNVFQKSGTSPSGASKTKERYGTKAVENAAAKPAETHATVSALPSAATAIDGTWSATIADSKGSAAVQFNLFQDSKGSVVGTYASSLGGGGRMNGRITHNELTFELTQTIQGCPGTFKGTAVVAGNKGTGTFTGSDCQGDHGTGTFTMNKVGPHALTATEELAERDQILKVGMPGYLRSKLFQWTLNDAIQIMGERQAHRYAYDQFHNIVGDIYSFADPQLQWHHVELVFDSKTAKLTQAILYPNSRTTWADIMKLLGDKFSVTSNADGTKIFLYTNGNNKLSVYVDKDENVLNVAIF